MQAPPQRDTGHWAYETPKELQLHRENVHYIPTLHWVGETRRKNTQNNPHVQGARTQDIQNESGHPNSPTIHQTTHQVSPVAYKVDLPPRWQIHLVFHIDCLKRYVRSEELLREVEPPPPVLVEDHLEYKVEDLIRHRGRGVRRQYLVLWKGYPFIEAT